MPPLRGLAATARAGAVAARVRGRHGATVGGRATPVGAGRVRRSRAARGWAVPMVGVQGLRARPAPTVSHVEARLARPSRPARPRTEAGGISSGRRRQDSCADGSGLRPRHDRARASIARTPGRRPARRRDRGGRRLADRACRRRRHGPRAHRRSGCGPAGETPPAADSGSPCPLEAAVARPPGRCRISRERSRSAPPLGWCPTLRGAGCPGTASRSRSGTSSRSSPGGGPRRARGRASPTTRHVLAGRPDDALARVPSPGAGRPAERARASRRRRRASLAARVPRLADEDEPGPRRRRGAGSCPRQTRRRAADPTSRRRCCLDRASRTSGRARRPAARCPRMRQWARRGPRTPSRARSR